MRAYLLALICIAGLSTAASAVPLMRAQSPDSHIVKVECGSEGPRCHYGTFRACPGPDPYGNRQDCDCVPCRRGGGYYYQQPQYAPPPPYYSPRRGYGY